MPTSRTALANPSFLPQSSNRVNPPGYIARMAPRYRSPFELYLAIARDIVKATRRRKLRSRFFQAMTSLLLVVYLLLSPLTTLTPINGSQSSASPYANSLAQPQTASAEILSSGTDVFLAQNGAIASDNYCFQCSNPPSKAIDNDGSTWYGSPASVNRYWDVTLPRPTQVVTLTIYQDGNDYATAADILAGVSGGQLVLIKQGVALAGGTQDISLPAHGAFSVYHIHAYAFHTTSWKVFTISGYATDPPLPPPSNDLFNGKTTSDNWCFQCAYPPSNAVDGNEATAYWPPYNANRYWRVDLGYSTVLKKMRMHQDEVGGKYLTSFDVQGSVTGSTFTDIITNVTGVPGWQDISLPTNATVYRYYQVVPRTWNSDSWAVFAIEGYGDTALTQDEMRAPNGSEPGTPRCDEGQPVNCATGNFWHTFTDLSVPGRGIPLQYSRTYNSLANNENGRLGYGWTDNYNMYVVTGTTVYTVYQENGSVVPFPITNTQYTRVEASLLRNQDGTFVMTRTHGLDRFYFTAQGKLSQIAGRNGYTTTLTYDNNGLLQSVTDPASRQLNFSYTLTDTTYYLTGVTDPVSHSVSFGYDSSGNLQTATDVGGNRMGYTYDGSHRMLTMTDPNNGTLTNEYDGQSRVTRQTDPLSHTLDFGYAADSISATTRITSALGLVKVEYYIDLLPVRIIQNPGDNQTVTDYTYQPGTTFPSKVTDPLGNITHVLWDTHGNVISTTDALARTVLFAYNTSNDVTAITNTRGLTTTFGYDQWGNVTTVTRPLTESNQLITTTFGYDPVKHGDLLTVTNPLGKNWTMTYNTYGYVESATNPLTEGSSYTYNPIGWLLSATSPRGYTSSYTYTTYGEPKLVTDTLGYTTVYTYDNVGNLINARDANGRIITNTFDLDNELTRATRPDNTHSDYGYDSLGRTITQTNGLGQLTRYAYDDINRVITYTDNLTRSTVSRFDLAGNLSSVTDAKNQTTTLGYDAAYQLKNIDYSDSGTHDVAFDYNNLGMRTIMTDGVGTTTYSYDSLTRLTSVHDGNGKTVSYAYDIASRPITITYPFGGPGTHNVIRQYNDANRLTSVQDWLNHTTSFGYNQDGALTSITRPNGANTSVGYDAADQVITKTDAITSTPFLSFTFQLDPVGVLTSIAEANTAGSVGTHTYSYDTRYRLTQDDLPSTSNNTWQYDAATQILTTTYQSGGGSPITGVRTYDGANQIKTLNETQGGSFVKQLTYTFDNNGNRTSRFYKQTSTTTNYAYDQADRLVTYNTGPTAITYSYNGDGLRLVKTSAVTVNQFAWDIGVEGGGLPLLLQDHAASYVYGPGGMLLEELIAGGGLQSDTPYYYHTDQLGSVRVTTNNSGAVANTYTYDAYGKPLTSTGSTYNPFGYTGEYTDAESGFIYLRARYYDPESQQFLTVDPALAWIEQAYAYVGGSPTNAIDPTGLTQCGTALCTDKAGMAGQVGGASGGTLIGGFPIVAVVTGAVAAVITIGKAVTPPSASPPTIVTAKREKPTSKDIDCDTEPEALDEALRRNDAPPVAENSIEREQVYGKNPNLKGPNGEPWERIHALDVEGNTITIDNHKWGHVFEDDGSQRGPHYHGPNGEHINYP